jgi:hypothetical protein
MDCNRISFELGSQHNKTLPENPNTSGQTDNEPFFIFCESTGLGLLGCEIAWPHL